MGYLSSGVLMDVILVNEKGDELGNEDEEKAHSHLKPLLHKAYCYLLLFDDKAVLITRDFKEKLWPKYKDCVIKSHYALSDKEIASKGLSVKKVEKIGEFIYYANYSTVAAEYEYCVLYVLHLKEKPRKAELIDLEESMHIENLTPYSLLSLKKYVIEKDKVNKN